jgi:hypothetical protein
MSRAGWATAFGVVAMLTAFALVTFWLLRPRALEGDLSK